MNMHRVFWGGSWNYVAARCRATGRIGIAPGGRHHGDIGFRCSLAVRSGSFRVLRGGSWYLDAAICRAALRGNDDPGNRYGNLGFRCWRKK